MSNRALQHASEWDWDSEEKSNAESVAGSDAESLIDPEAEREWQELLAWAFESGALHEPARPAQDRVAVRVAVRAEESEEEEWGWQLARAKAVGDDAA
jgi:hypothetical protein